MDRDRRPNPDSASGFSWRESPFAQRARRILTRHGEKLAPPANAYEVIDQALRQNRKLTLRRFDAKLNQKVTIGTFMFLAEPPKTELTENDPPPAPRDSSVVVERLKTNGYILVQDPLHFAAPPGLRTSETVFLYPDGTGTRSVITNPGTAHESQPGITSLEPEELDDLYEKFSSGQMVRLRF